MSIYRLIFVVAALTASVHAFSQDDIYTPEVGKSVRPRMKVLTSEARDGYECLYVEYATDSEERIKAYLLVPEGAGKKSRRPGILMLHDHGARFDIGKEKYVRPIASVLKDGADDHVMRSSQQWADKNFDGVHLGDSLAQLGYVVLAADALYWGERSTGEAQRWSELTYGDPGHASLPEDRALSAKARKDTIKALKNRVYDGQQVLYERLESGGVIWAEKMLRDDAAALRLLKSLPYVDEENVGAFGFSMGAHRCWMLAAFCKEVRCGVALSWMTTLDLSERMKASDYSMAVMPMREKLDFGDIGMFLAPVPFLFLNGETDHLFPAGRVGIAFEKLKGHYAEYNERRGLGHTPDPLQTRFFKGGHHCGKSTQKIIVEYFDQNLR